MNALFDALPAATKAYYHTLDAAATAAEATGASKPFGPTTCNLSRDRAKALAQRSREKIRAAIVAAFEADAPMTATAVIPADMRPTKPANVCGEFGDSIDDLKAFVASERSLMMMFKSELASVTAKYLKDYDANPQLNDGARGAVAAAFGVAEDDACFTILPPLSQQSVNVRWHGSGTRAAARRLCNRGLQTLPGQALQRSVVDIWDTKHKTINVATLPKLGQVPPNVTRSWQKNVNLNSHEGVIADMMRAAYVSVEKRLFPPKSAHRTALASCEIICVFVGVRAVVADVLPAGGVEAMAEGLDGPAGAATDDFVPVLINRHCLSPWEPTFMQLLTATDPRDAANHYISVDVYGKQLDAYEAFSGLAFGFLGDGFRMTWSAVFFKLMKRQLAVDSVVPDLQGAERLFDDGDSNGTFDFWNGKPDEEEVAAFKRRRHHPVRSLPNGNHGTIEPRSHTDQRARGARSHGANGPRG
jgi:hypothetical protein